MNQLVMSYAWKYNNIEAYVLDLIVNERIEAKVGLLQESSASAWYKSQSQFVLEQYYQTDIATSWVDINNQNHLLQHYY